MIQESISKSVYYNCGYPLHVFKEIKEFFSKKLWRLVSWYECRQECYMNLAHIAHVGHRSLVNLTWYRSKVWVGLTTRGFVSVIRVKSPRLLNSYLQVNPGCMWGGLLDFILHHSQSHISYPSLVNKIKKLLHLLPIGLRLEPSKKPDMISELGIGWPHLTWSSLRCLCQIISSPQFVPPNASRLHMRGSVGLYPTLPV